MKEYHYVTMQISARLEFEVDAESVEEAKRLARHKCRNVIYGLDETLSMNEEKLISVCDRKGNILNDERSSKMIAKSKEQVIKDVCELSNAYDNAPDDFEDPAYLDIGEWLDWHIDVMRDILKSVEIGNINLDNQTCDKIRGLIKECLDSPTDSTEPGWFDDADWLADFNKLLKEAAVCLN